MDEIGPVGPMQEPRLNPSDLDWWWQYGFDGFVGGFIGAAVTGLAVWLTLRAQRGQLTATLEHEREQLAATFAHEREQSRKTELRQSVVALQAVATRSMFMVPSHDEAPGWDEWASELSRAFMLVSANSRGLAPALHRDIDKAYSLLYVGDTNGTANAKQSAKQLSAIASVWLEDPEGYEEVDGIA